MVAVEEWQLGVAASCLASLLGTFGVQLRILAIALEGGGSEARAKGCQLCGWTSWIVGQALNQVAILLAPATIVACVTFSGSLLCNAMLAPFVLREELTRMHGLGILLLSAGGSAVTVTSGHGEQRYNLVELFGLLQRAPFFGTSAGCLLLAAVLAGRALHRCQLDTWSFAYIFSLCGATDLLVTKCTLLLLRQWAEGSHQRDLEAASDMDDPPPTLVLSAFAVCMVLLHLSVLGCQVASTRYGDALQNTPLFLGSGAMMQVALCGTFFQEFSDFGGERIAAFGLGFGMMLLGLAVTSHAPKAKGDSQMAKAISPSKKRQKHLGEPLLPAPLDELPESESEAAVQSPLACLALNLPRLPSTPMVLGPDLLLVGGIQRTSVCFHHSPAGDKESLERRVHSWPGTPVNSGAVEEAASGPRAPRRSLP